MLHEKCGYQRMKFVWLFAKGCLQYYATYLARN